MLDRRQDHTTATIISNAQRATGVLPAARALAMQAVPVALAVRVLASRRRR